MHVALLSVLGPLQAKCLLSGATSPVGTCIIESIPLAALGLLISLFIVAITFMIGEVFNYEQLKGWYKKELWETAKSAMFIAIVFSLLIIFSGIATMLAGNSATYFASVGTSPSSALSSNLQGLYATAVNTYLDTAQTQAREAFSALYGLSVGIGVFKGMTLAFWLPLIPFPALTPVPPFVIFPFGAVQFGGEINPLTSNFLESAKSPQVSLINDALSMVVLPVFMLIEAQKDLLTTITLSGLSVFLPLGILLRSMPFLRRLGGTLIAIGISLSLIYPALLVGFNLPITNYFNNIPPPTAATTVSRACAGGGLPPTIRIVTGIVCAFVNTLSNMFPSTRMVSMVLGNDARQSSVVTTAFTDGFIAAILTQINGNIFSALNIVVDYTLPTIMQFLLFIADLFIGITLTNAIAKPLGGTLRLSIGKMKLG